jgi:CheY-like chemotaxis protein
MPKNVMIIDDEADIRVYLASILEDHGLSPCSPEENEPVVAAVRRHRPDLILLDIMMPGQSGIAVYRELLSAPDLARIPVVLVSGMLSGAGFSAEGFRQMFGGDDLPLPEGFIDKPIVPNQLIALVKRLSGAADPAQGLE